MMENKGFGRPKTKEELQTQVENFAETQLTPEFQEDEILFQNAARHAEKIGMVSVDFDNPPIGLGDKMETALKDRTEFYRYSKELSKIKDLDNLPENISPIVRELIEKYKDSYIAFLKQESNASREFQVECITKYEKKFAPIIKELKDEMIRATSPKDVAGYIDSGNYAHVYKIETHAGVYAIKIYNNKNDIPGIDAQDLVAMRRAKNIENVSHIEAYSHKDNAIVMDFIEGQNLKEFTSIEKPDFTDEELKNISDTVISLYNVGVRMDANPKNIILGKDGKFTIIDYITISGECSLESCLEDVAEVLAIRKDISYDTHQRAFLSEQIFQRIQKIMKEKLSNE